MLSAPEKEFAIEALAYANASMDMKAKLAKELLALMIALAMVHANILRI